jgi:hypothetical protein
MTFDQAASALQTQLANRQLLASIPGKTAIFYSGVDPNTNVYDGKTAADCQAQFPNQYYTIANTPAGQFIETVVAQGGFTAAQADQLWTIASTPYAQQASGDVIAFVNGANPSRVFGSIELPQLLSNLKNVNSINGRAVADDCRVAAVE